MKKRIALLLSCLLAFCCAMANDGGFYALGNTLMPLQQTNIELKKERLWLTRKDHHLLVTVDFDFYNPGAEQEIIVGFVTPPAGGDIDVKNAEHPQLTDFTVNVNGSKVPYKIVKMEGSGFRLADTVAGGDDFVYYFNLKFPKGMTHIRHTYRYHAGNDIVTREDYNYRLTTGTTWGNHEIEDFELVLDMGEDVFFTLPYELGSEKAGWEIRGVGRMATWFTNDTFYQIYGARQMMYMRKGKVALAAKHFKPTKDFFATVYERRAEIYLGAPKEVTAEFDVLVAHMYEPKEEEIRSFSDRQLRLLINLPYARAGYMFKDTALRSTFERFTWYMPDVKVQAVFKPYYYDAKVAAMLNKENTRRKNAAKH